MSLLLLILSTVVAALIFLFSLLSISRIVLRNIGKKRTAPELPGAWPVIGHLHLLGGPEPSHRVLDKMADKYGPIFTIKMGVHKILVVSSWEIAKECLTTNDKAFANRPKTTATKILGYNFAFFGLSPYGPYWRQARKIGTQHLLSNHQLEKFRHVRESEVKTCSKELYEVWVKNTSSNGKVLVEMRRWFGDITLNMILRLIVGKRWDGEVISDGWKEQLTIFFDFLGKFVVSDAIPFLRWLDIGQERLMKKTAKQLDIFVQGWLEEHKRKRVSGERELKEDEDFMDVMLSIMNDPQQFPQYDSDTVIKAICLNLILAATDTTTVTLTWALSLLLNNRDVLNNVQKELDNEVGNERQVNESDMKNLVYLQAVIKETMRLYPAGPLSIPHESMEDCNVSGYHVPSGTQLHVNVWKIHRDPRVWSNPCEFKPERFITTHKDFDVSGKNYAYIPFGSGRRMCPGVSFSLQVMQLSLATLLHGFDFATPSNEPVDMSEGWGITLVKTNPINVLLSPRLPSFVYG